MTGPRCACDPCTLPRAHGGRCPSTDTVWSPSLASTHCLACAHMCLDDGEGFEPQAPPLEDLPTARSYVLEYAWGCDECGTCNGTDDIDEAGTVQECGNCGQRTRITT